MDWDELLTTTIGFALAIILLGAVIAGGIYAYHAYVHQEVLKLYMRPVVDIVPASSGYYLAVINTGHEPFQPRAVLYPNGTLTSVSAPILLGGQYWLASFTTRPSAVYICSALDPHVCTFVGANNYTIYNPAAWGNGTSCPITASVSDKPNAGWEVTWNYTNNGVNYKYSYNGSTTENFCVIPPYTPINITFNSAITSTPTGYTCSISPSQLTSTYNIGNTQGFTVTCYGTVSVSVTNDAAGAGWQVNWTDAQGVISGSQSGTSNAQWTINNIPYGDTLSLNAQITSNPTGFTCSISPTSTTASPDQSVTFTVTCLGSINITVSDSYGAGWNVTWSGAVSGSQSGSTTQSWSISNVPYGSTVNLQASITSVPSGYATCSINPTSTSATANQSVAFTVTCYKAITVTVTNDTLGATWQVTWSGAASGSQTGSSSASWTIYVPDSGSISLSASITSSPSGYTCSISPTSTTATGGQSVTFTVSCQQQLVPVTITVNDQSPGDGTWELEAALASNGQVLGSMQSSSSGSTTVNVPSGDTIDIYTSFISVNNGYICSISPGMIQATITSPTTFTFTASCTYSPGSVTNGIVVTVNDPYGAGWVLQWNDIDGAASGSTSGTSSTQFTLNNIPSGDSVVFIPGITSVPSGYSSCTISPGTIYSGSGTQVTFTITCQ